MRISKFTLFTLLASLAFQVGVMVYINSTLVQQHNLILDMTRNPACMIGPALKQQVYRNPDIYIGVDENVKHFDLPPDFDEGSINREF